MGEASDVELNSGMWTRVLCYQLEMLELEATLGFTKE